MTDRVEEMLIGGPSEGQGMGVMLQLGPKWIRQYGENIEELVMNVHVVYRPPEHQVKNALPR